jgi:hypothetical protein
MVRRPVVQIIEEGEDIPFDVAQSRTIHVDHRDLDSAARCREELVKQIRASEANPMDVDTPISVAVDLQALRQSDDPLKKSNAEIMSMLQDIRATLARLPRDMQEVVGSEGLVGRLLSPVRYAMDHIRMARDEASSSDPRVAESLEDAARALDYTIDVLSDRDIRFTPDPSSISRRRRRPISQDEVR